VLFTSCEMVYMPVAHQVLTKSMYLSQHQISVMLQHLGWLRADLPGAPGLSDPFNPLNSCRICHALNALTWHVDIGSIITGACRDIINSCVIPTVEAPAVVKADLSSVPLRLATTRQVWTDLAWVKQDHVCLAWDTSPIWTLGWTKALLSPLNNGIDCWFVS